MEKHVCCDCKSKTKKRHKLVDFFRFRKNKKVQEEEEGREEVKENGEVTTGEEVSGESGDAIAASGGNNVKTEEKTAAGNFFWNSLKRDADSVSAEKTAKQPTEEELNEETKTTDLATEVMILNMEIWKPANMSFNMSQTDVTPWCH